MSMNPDMYPAEGHFDNPDSYDEMDEFYCRSDLERLIEEGRILGKIVTTDKCSVELESDITDPNMPPFNDCGVFTNAGELVQMTAYYDEYVNVYRIRHALVLQVSGHDPQKIDRIFKPVFVREGTKFTLHPEFSSYCITYTSTKTEEGFTAIHNEGYPLDDTQRLKLLESRDDTRKFNGYQFHELRQLAARALDGIRAS